MAARGAKVPLVLGGAAVAGVAGGLAVKARGGRRSRRIGGLPLSLPDGKLDLEAVEAAAKRLSAFSKQVGEIAGAVQRGTDHS